MNRHFITTTLAAALALAGCQAVDAPSDRAATEAAGARSAADSRWIVVFDRSVQDPRAAARQHAADFGRTPLFIYEHALSGFAVELPDSAATALSRRAGIAWIEPDQLVYANAQTTPTGIQRTFADGNTNLDIDGSDDLRIDVDIAIIDTGIDLDHPDLYVVGSADCTGGGPFNASCSDGGGDDGNGHGSHCAGSAAALDNGIGVVGMAPGARLWAVKVLKDDGSGWNSGVIAGVDWVTARADTIEVANMSLGGGDSPSLCEAVDNAAAAGVAIAAAAGNDGSDAANQSPANCSGSLAVSALADYDGEPGGLASPTCYDWGSDDTLASFSNYGDTVDIAAPGVCILSTWAGGSYDTISGTSMASPHAAGALGLLASGAGDPQDLADVEALYDTLETQGNFDWTDDSGDGTQEPLLDVSNETVFAPATVSGGGDDGGTTNAAPTASFTYACTDLTCDFDGSGSSDSDGSISSYDWDFGDGTTGTGDLVSKTYASGGAYTVILTVTDDDGATGSDSQDVSVSDTSGAYTLDAVGYKVRGLQKADLSWSGSSATSLDVYRDGSIITTTANDGFYTDHIDQRGGASYTYQLCDAGTTTCSNEDTVTF